MIDATAREEAKNKVAFRMLRDPTKIPILRNGSRHFMVCFKDELVEDVMKQIKEFYNGHCYLIILDPVTYKAVDCREIYPK